MNTQDRFQRVEALFREALRLAPEKRAAYLDEACSDARMRADVQELLEEDAMTQGAIDAPVMERGIDTLFGESNGEKLPEYVGQYRVLSRLGEGGFGTVYLAEQREPVQRQVAVKILKLGMDTKQVIARFEAERQALAMMEHPSIAKVFDAGATDSGRPYFVMELVRGVPVTAYCDEHALGTDERIELFLQICRAVQHAHQKGVIHRDLKPSNVLVVEQDGKPIPKIIDFGIAKASSARLTEKTVFTEHRQLIGTPEYMSPEQAGMGHLDIDTRSDIYSLGVLLYELLTGTTPFDVRSLRSAAFAELQRIIREVDPEKPSTRLSSLTHISEDLTSGPTLHEIAQRRRTDASTLRRQIRGDLDWIVMRAMEKDRNRRYESASALAADLNRHLHHEPVTAGPPSLRYRAAKFIRRNRMGVTAGAVMAAGLVVGSVLAVNGMIRAERERDRAVSQEERATAINNFLVRDLLAEAAPENNAVDSRVTVHELLDRAAEKINDGRFADQPHARAGVLSVIADTYWALGDFEHAAEYWEQCVELNEELEGPLATSTGAALNGLYQAYQDLGRLDDASEVMQSLLKATKAAHADDSAEAMMVTNNYAEMLVAQGRLAEAEPIHQENLANRRKALGDGHPDTLESMNNLGAVYYLRGDAPRAEELFRESWTTRQDVLGEDHPNTLISMSNLGVALKAQNKLEETEEIYRAVLAASARVLGPEHPDTLTDMNNLASLLFAQDKMDECIALHHQALELRRKVLGPDHVVVAHSLVGYGDALAKAGRAVEAEAPLREAVELRRKHFTPDHHLTVSATRALANCLVQLERTDDAAAELLIAWDAMEEQGGISSSRRQIAEALVKLFQETGDQIRGAEWSDKLEALEEDDS